LPRRMLTWRRLAGGWTNTVSARGYPLPSVFPLDL
jgi:hypothetical protein